MDVSMSTSMMPILKGSTDYHSWRKHFKRYVKGINPIMKAVTTILNAIAPNVAVSIDDDEERSAHQIWKLLEDHYSKGTVIQLYILLTELVQLSQIGGVGKFISNIEHISTESSLMGKPIGPDIKLGCLLRGIQPHPRPYTATYEAEWESTKKEALDKKMQTDEKSVETQLHRLFNCVAMNLRNHESSAQLKEQDLTHRLS
ncbi:uncharacterized protein UBRO_20785 [Ustilago bromivora]|uniref:Uncharacterized protein n=1 Tax=Ustilago bromivora TaxID=307758 RepID=A0A1K0H7F5_9BASI|nr:uncharacterized protein UBRO_20785 [Ustilago bromivora]